MHLTIHRPLVHDAAEHARRAGAGAGAVHHALRPPPPPEPPRPDLRARAALVLARLARRLDGETARRAVA